MMTMGTVLVAPVPAQAATTTTGTTIHVPSDCPASTPGQSPGECVAGGAGRQGGHLLGVREHLDCHFRPLYDRPGSFLYLHTDAAKQHSDGPDGLPAIINQVTIQSAVSGGQAVIQRSSSVPPFRFFDVAGTGPNGVIPARYQTPSDVTNQTTTAVPGGASLTLDNIELEGGLAQGGNGADCGGGGAGLGGAIFAHRGTVTLVDSTLNGNLAQGGSGGSDTADCRGGGGGMGGNGGAGYLQSGHPGTLVGGGSGAPRVMDKTRPPHRTAPVAGRTEQRPTFPTGDTTAGASAVAPAAALAAAAAWTPAAAPAVAAAVVEAVWAALCSCSAAP